MGHLPLREGTDCEGWHPVRGLGGGRGDPEEAGDAAPLNSVALLFRVKGLASPSGQGPSPLPRGVNPALPQAAAPQDPAHRPSWLPEPNLDSSPGRPRRGGTKRDSREGDPHLLTTQHKCGERVWDRVLTGRGGAGRDAAGPGRVSGFNRAAWAPRRGSHSLVGRNADQKTVCSEWPREAGIPWSKA